MPLAILGVLALAIPPSSALAAQNEQSSTDPVFTYEAVTSAVVSNTAFRSSDSFSAGEGLNPEVLGLSAIEVDGEVAVVNHSLVRQDTGAIAAATADYVDLSWAPMPGVRDYIVSKNGELLGITAETALRDTDVTPDTFVDYQVSANMFVDPEVQEAPIHGLIAFVPAASSEPMQAAEREISETATTVVSYTRANLDWATFIPQARLDAPSIGCEFGAGYEFSGDNRGFAATQYDSGMAGARTMLHAIIFWDDPVPANVVTKSYSTGWTKVYDKTTGLRVGERRADNGLYEAYLLGTDAARSYVDVRMRIQVGNPFCSGNSIEGAFTITLSRTGSYTISSGAHRQMPNHEIFIRGTSPEGGIERIVYQRQYLDPICLVQMLCPSAQMGGYAGSF